MSNIRIVALFFLVVLIIIFSWFKEGKIISNNSEENLNILSPSRSALNLSTFWWSVGTGTKNPFFIPREGAFLMLSLMEKVGIPSFMIQAIFLGLIMFGGMILIYIFVKYGLGLNSFIAVISSLFYLLNIYSLTQVWKRFLYHGMIAWAYLPFFLLLWFKWISGNRVKWLFLFLISSLFFTYAFSHPAYLLTFWIPAGILVLIRAWDFRKDFKSILKLTGFTLLGLVLWCVVNIWWLYPTFLLARSWTDENLPQTDINLNILTAVSRSFPLNEILFLRQSWYLGHENDWYDFYHNPLVYLISICILGVAVLGFVKLKNNKYRKYLTGLALVGLFISKGSNFPLGFSFFQFLFSTFPFTASLRNSYEKFGLVWVLSYSILFAYGLYYLYTKLGGKFKFFFLSLLLFLSCGVLVYPIWNGDIFPSKHKVVVPFYYKEANNFLNSQNTERVFHIPFTTEVEKITYDWGYVGEDPSENIFDSEPLTSPNAPLYNKIYKLLPGFLDKEYFTNILGLLGAQYIIFHRDNIYPKIDLIKTQNQIESWRGVKKEEIFDKLSIYNIDSQLVKPRIYAAVKIIKINSLEDALNEVSSKNWNVDSVFTSEDININLKDLIPQIAYNKISTVHYRVKIKDSTNQYILVLNNTFDNLWQAKVGRDVLEKHFIVNGFANGWLVSKIGDYEINIILKVWPWQ